MRPWSGFCSWLLCAALVNLGVVSRAAADGAPGAWATITSLPAAGFDLAATTGADGRVYVLGGCADSGCDSPLAAAEAYDPRANAWTALPPLPTPRWATAAAAGLDGRIYVLGGCGRPVMCAWSQMLTRVDVYDPATNRWGAAAPLPVGRFGLAAATDRAGRIYAIGGCCSPAGDTDLVERYDPGTNAWTVIAPLPTGRYGLQAVSGDDGRIYAIGGEPLISSLDQPLDATVEAYEPGNGPVGDGGQLAGALDLLRRGGRR